MPKHDDEPRVQLATRIPTGLHGRLKLHCVATETTQMQFLVRALREKDRLGTRKRAKRVG